MKIPDLYKLNFHPLELEVVEVLDFQGHPVLTLEKNIEGFKYLSYLLRFEEGLEQRLVVPLTEQRLKALKNGKTSVKTVFGNSELGQVFIMLFDEKTGATLETWLLPIQYFQGINPIPSEYRIATTILS